MSDPEEPVGSVAEEAAKLFAAFQGWAKDNGGEYAATAASAAEGAATAFHQVGEHVATGSAECTYCPVCRVIAAVRDTSPEVRQHLTTAATSLMHAAAGMLATHVSDSSARRGDTGVEKIDIEDGADDTDDEGEDV